MKMAHISVYPKRCFLMEYYTLCTHTNLYENMTYPVHTQLVVVRHCIRKFLRVSHITASCSFRNYNCTLVVGSLTTEVK